MGEAITARTDPATPTYHIQLDPSDYTVKFKDGNSSIDLQKTGGAIVYLDWVDLSSDTFVITESGYVADKFFEFLFGGNADKLFNGHYLGEVPIHLIGHSRGASVNTRLAGRLAQFGILIEQVTTLDPHPVSIWSSDVPVGHYINTIFADNYYRTWAYPSGDDIDGADNLNLSTKLTGNSLSCSEHNTVHTYYHGTIDLSANTDGSCTIYPNWYEGLFPRNWRGFNLSRTVGQNTFRSSEGIHSGLEGGNGEGERTHVDTVNQRWPNAGFDQRKWFDNRVTVGETMEIPYYYRDRKSPQEIQFYIDKDDTNPFDADGPGREIGLPQHQGSVLGGTIGAGVFSWAPTPADVGTWYVHLKTTNTFAGLQRFDHLVEKVTVSAAPIVVTKPTATTNSETNVGQTRATLNASVTPNGADTTAYFEYGITSSYGQPPTGLQNVGSGASAVSVSQTVYGLACGTTYHYRIRADSGLGSDEGSDRNFTTTACNQSAPPPPTGVDASDGKATNGIYISWNASSGASYYKVYRATSIWDSISDLTSALTVRWDRTEWAVGDVIADRIYYFWIKACNSQGICSDYSAPDTGYMGNAESPVLPAINPSPEHEDTNVSTTVGDLEWDNGGGATSYEVYFGTDSTPDSGEYIGSRSSTSKSIPDLEYNTTYYWRVDSIKGEDTTTGQVWSFTTGNESSVGYPERAIYTEPNNYAVDVPKARTILAWENGGGATSYDIYFGTNRNPGEDEFIKNTTSTAWLTPMLEYWETYYWKVKARSSAGTAKADVWQFRVEPPAPFEVWGPQPNDGEADVSTSVARLNWYDRGNMALSFDVYFGTDPTPDLGDFLGNTPANKKTWELPELALNTTYYWQIVAKNKAGETYSPVWRFSTWDSVPGILNVSEGAYSVYGPVGGPFAPGYRAYTLKNVGQAPLDYTILVSKNWLNLSQTSGTLAPGAVTTVEVSPNSNADFLTKGVHYDVAQITNSTNGEGDDARTVSLAVGTLNGTSKAAKIYSGSQYTMVIDSDTNIYGWGLNVADGVGLGVPQLPDEIPSPIKVNENKGWRTLSLGFAHRLGIKEDGTLWAWGVNSDGQLGVGDNIDRSAPTQVGMDNDWKAVSAGYLHSLALKEDGRLYAFGDNWLGALGLGDEIDRNVPTQVGSGSDWHYIPPKLNADQSLAIKNNGELYTWGFRMPHQSDTQLTPSRLGADRNWEKVVESYGTHFVGLKTNGKLFAWGHNGRGQLGLGDFVDRDLPAQVGTDQDWVEIAVGDRHTLGLKDDGSLYSWGQNYYGQLGLGDRSDRKTPTLVIQDPDIVQISADAYSSSQMLLASGAVYKWGRNGHGNIGLGYLSDWEVFPVEVDLLWESRPFEGDYDRDGIKDDVDPDDDNDGVPDIHDQFPLNKNESRDSDGDGLGDNADPDDDNDTVLDTADNCRVTFNPKQLDQDNDDIGDLCDTDADGDGIDNVEDNCPFFNSTDQTDTDGDGAGDVCDLDKDNDGVFNTDDSNSANPHVCEDTDFDTCDDCSIGVDQLGPLPDNNSSKDGTDTDSDGACNAGDDDDDNDGIPDISDNCILIPNFDQKDSDKNGVGDVCEEGELCFPIKVAEKRFSIICL